MDQIWQNFVDILEAWGQSFQENLPKIVMGIVILALSVYLGRVIRRLVTKTLQRRQTDHELVILLSRISLWTVVGLGMVLALEQAGQDVGALLAGLGILGFTVGFALQDVSKNFVAGILLLLQQPFEIGDNIEVSGYSGKVIEINLRDTVIVSFDGLRVSIPNSAVFTTPITNFSNLPRRRLQVEVGVGYDTDLETVKPLVVGALEQVEGVLAEPAIDFRFHTFGDSAMVFTVYYWYDPAQTGYGEALHEGVLAVKKALDEAGIEMPYPHQITYSR